MSEKEKMSVREFRRECRRYGSYLQAFGTKPQQYVDLSQPLSGEQEKVRKILQVIWQVPMPSYRIMVWRAYIQHQTIKSIAEDLNFSSDYLLKSVKEQLCEALERTDFES
ncbi:MAG: hypothetical protein LKE64_02050 [Solobacterium sp.]|jgi:hypothetical protein|nr:hypothetical protein [Solobacterium sp.]MCH4049776.1 hypothetical protein [Solobacterium sp.]MCH4073461.1 hypothetical protein [Solobacterium sp.]MCI1313399.1 hypothetical protein [Solobacterium sp.]MCI1345697.1 hypothetical protein [Solobacterium sp.]